MASFYGFSAGVPEERSMSHQDGDRSLMLNDVSVQTPRAPKDLQLVAATNRHIRLSWSHIQRPKPVSSYRIFYRDIHSHR